MNTKGKLSFCTCEDTNCPLHPSNHDKGCNLCIAKNLKKGEIPTCFFKKINFDYWRFCKFLLKTFKHIIKEIFKITIKNALIYNNLA